MISVGANGRRPEPSTVDVLAGFLAAAALFFGLIALAYRPVPVATAAILLGLVATAMSDRHRRLAAVSLLISSLCFVAGVSVAVVTDNPLW